MKQQSKKFRTALHAVLSTGRSRRFRKRVILPPGCKTRTKGYWVQISPQGKMLSVIGMIEDRHVIYSEQRQTNDVSRLTDAMLMRWWGCIARTIAEKISNRYARNNCSGDNAAGIAGV